MSGPVVISILHLSDSANEALRVIVYENLSLIMSNSAYLDTFFLLLAMRIQLIMSG